mmetsp:Transcript_9460/g.26515  ORF Transcript_9460/g.26515 Transcript_9460/m.26515 type:complete len:220 (-) Transcript_9460:410-1069(-)
MMREGVWEVGNLGERKLVANKERENLVDDRGSGQGGYVSVVIRRGYFHDVRGDQVEAVELPNRGQKLSRRQTPRLGGPRPGGVRWVEYVNINREIYRRVAHPFPDPLRNGLNAPLEFFRPDHPEAELRVLHQVLLGIDWAVNSYMDGPIRQQQPLLPRSPERRAVREPGPKIFRPGIEVRVKVNERHGFSGCRRDRAEERERHGVITPDGHYPLSSAPS